ncbi:MAG: hypothetical protein A2Y07_04005 [Planctomycetes bacterium GWF2_50_10]|nr:MAG: hypothetical protein A2Y07_04005 [Planctomycetes bacterium GWF2_50_10]
MALDWKQAIDLKREQVVGLDIGSASVKLVGLGGGSGHYTAQFAQRIETGVLPDEDDKSRRDKMVSAIRACFEMSRMQTRQVVCGVSGPEVAVRTFCFPSLPAEEVAEAVMLEAEQVCPFDARSNVVDYQIVKSNGKSKAANGQDITGLMVAATKDVIRRKIELVNGSYLNCAMMDVEGLALANCFGQTEEIEDGQVVAIVNIGGASTNIVILTKEGLPFVRDIAYGGDMIFNQIGLEFNTSRGQVASIFAGGEGRRKEEILAGLGKACSKLISDINESLRYYVIERRTAAINKVYICGGFSQVNGFSEMVGSQINCPVAVWNPLAKFPAANAGVRDVVERSGPAFAVAAGLAMRTI